MATKAAVPPRVAGMRGPACVRASTLLFTAAALLLAAPACNILDDDQELPGTARVAITGTAAGDLELVTSTDFLQVNDLEADATYTQLVRADTALIQPGFSRDYDIATTNRFFVRLTNHATDVADVTLTVSFDGVVEYNQQATMSEGGALEFSEIFFGT